MDIMSCLSFRLYSNFQLIPELDESDAMPLPTTIDDFRDASLDHHLTAAVQKIINNLSSSTGTTSTGDLN